MDFSVVLTVSLTLFVCIRSNAQLMAGNHDNVDPNFRVNELESRVKVLTQDFKKIKEAHANEIRDMKDEIENLKNLVVKATENKSSNKHSKPVKEDVLEELKEFQKEVMESVKESLKNNTSVIYTKYNDVARKLQKMENIFHFNNHQKRLTGTNSVTQIAFHAGMKSVQRDVYPGTIVKFDDLKFDIGGNYNPNQGAFVANVSGVYLFFATIVSSETQQFRSVMKKNDQPIAYIHSPLIDEDFGPGSNMAIVSLHRGDQIWVEAIDQHLGDCIDNWSSFSGYLLFPELVWNVVG